MLRIYAFVFMLIGFAVTGFTEEAPATSDDDEYISERLAQIKKAIAQKSTTDFKRLRNPFDFDPNAVLAPPAETAQNTTIADYCDIDPVKLEGIIGNSNRRQALISANGGPGEFVSVGDKVRGVAVEAILEDRVVFIQKIGPLEMRATLEMHKPTEDKTRNLVDPFTGQNPNLNEVKK